MQNAGEEGAIQKEAMTTTNSSMVEIHQGSREPRQPGTMGGVKEIGVEVGAVGCGCKTKTQPAARGLVACERGRQKPRSMSWIERDSLSPVRELVGLVT